jgi:hypothetical protein
MLQRNMDAEAHKSRDGNEYKSIGSPAAPGRRTSTNSLFHTRPAPVPLRRLLKRMSSTQQQCLFHMSADNLKTDRKTFCRLAAW